MRIMRIRGLALWNVGAMALALASASAIASRSMPTGVSAAEMQGLRAGSGAGSNLAVNAQSNQTNPCYYCVAVPKPSYGSIGCFDAGQILTNGVKTYTSTPTACKSEIRYWGANCTGGGNNTNVDCTSTKPIFVDP